MVRSSALVSLLSLAALLPVTAARVDAASGGAPEGTSEGTAGLEITAGTAPTDAVGFVDCRLPLAGNACLHVSCPNCSTPYSAGQVTSTWTLTDAQIKARTGFAQCSILDVNAAVHIDQSPIGGIAAVTLQHGTPQASLWAPPGACNANAIDAIFDDEAAVAANSCPPTGPKTLQSVDPLSSFDGQAVDGTWTLAINDSNGSGTLQAWGLAVDAHCDIVTTPPSSCHPTSTSICLQNDRFEVKATWQSANGAGVGTPVKLTPDTGYFWFFDPSNVEVVVKVLNGCGLNSRFWVFAGGLTNVKVTLIVKDTKTGQVHQYSNPLNKAFQPIQDVGALATCP